MITHNKKGFTLIEIIIVIVILGILATLALPRLTAQLEVGRAAEAMVMMGSLKNAALNCYDSTQTMVSCDTLAELGITMPANIRFTYTLTSVAPDEFRVRAVSQATGTNCIKMSVQGGGGVLGMTGYGQLISVVTRATGTAANGAAAGCAAY